MQRSQSSLTYSAMGGAALMVAYLVAGKTARDSLFLSRFDTTDLPKMFAGAAVFAIAAGIWFAKRLTRRGPERLLPAALLVSVALHLAEFALLGWRRGPIVVVVYLHVAGLGAILLSTFWSVANEAFDPRAAKQLFPRIAGAGTIGGIAGGLLAASLRLESLLILLAGFHALAILGVRRLGYREDAGAFRPVGDTIDLSRATRHALRQAPFMKNLGLLVLFGTVAAALLDYLFKAGAVRALGKGPELARYFALFYTANQVVTFLAQTFLTTPALRTLGLGRTVATLPLAVVAGAGGAWLFPSFVMSAVARSTEMILRGSLFRSAYELFFTPIPPREKRAVKTSIDVGCDRLGDMLGAAVIQLVLIFAADRVSGSLLLVTMTLAVVGVWIAAPMDKAYLRVLEHGLLNRAVELDEREIQDSTTLSALTRTQPRQQGPPKPAPLPRESARAADPALDRLRELRSGDASRVREALSGDAAFEPLAVTQTIRLLAWNEVCDAARAYLTRNSGRALGQLTDALLDTNYDFAVRRRIPRILAHCASQRTVDGLLQALADDHFEIRFQVSRALEHLHRADPGLEFDGAAVMDTVERELSVSKTIWQGRKLLDQRDESDTPYAYLDEVIRDRAQQSLEHVFSLLALVLPREPLKVAFRALHSDDRILRGLALEYLETAMPASSFSLLLGVIESAPPSSAGRNPHTVMEELMASHASILAHLGPSSDGVLDPRGTPPTATPA
jgi:ATP:ADP antiporter, AAA family